MLKIGNKWFSELAATPLGVVKLDKRRHRRGYKLPWKWVILLAFYLIAVVKLARNNVIKPTSLIRTLLGPVLFIFNKNE